MSQAPELDRKLIAHARRRRRPEGLSFRERVALNLFWRNGVSAAILAEVFKVSKNTIYYSAIPKRRTTAALEVDAYIEEHGEVELWRSEVLPSEIERVNQALARAAERKAAKRRKNAA